MKKVRYSGQAREDLLDLWVHIAKRDAQAADRIFERIQDSCRRLADYPQIGPARPEIGDGARALVIERWLALYRLVEDGVQIVRIIDGARDLARLDWPKDDADA